jgi:hypothetical protein
MMRIAPSILLAAVLMATMGPPAVCFAAEGGADGRAGAIRSLQTQLRSRLPSQRVEAVKRLRDFPALDALKLMVPSALTDREEEVRRAAYETLLTWKNDPEVCDALLKTLDREARDKKGGIAVIPPLIAVLLASDRPGAEPELNKFLEAYLAKSKDGVAVLTAVADEFGNQGDEQALGALRKLSRLTCFSERFACRRATVQAMIQIRRPEAVEALMALLPRVEGEVCGDVVRYLARISGKNLGSDLVAWRGWWKEHKEGFEFPDKADEAPPVEVASPGAPTYYGLSLNARRIVFVLDTSGSMHGPRLQAAQYELTRAIEGLAGDISFNIVSFSNVVAVWQKNLVPAKPATKRGAAQFVSARRAGGHTAAYDALEAAFQFDAEAIYFLSDGAPNVGKIVAPADIVAAVSQANRSRRISVYTIGIAPGSPDGPFDTFLRTLAEKNSGAYRWIE